MWVVVMRCLQAHNCCGHKRSQVRLAHAIRSKCNVVCTAYQARLPSSLFQLSLCVSSELSWFSIKAFRSSHPDLRVGTAEGKEIGKCKREMIWDRQKLKSFMRISLEKDWKRAYRIISEYKWVLIRLLTDLQQEIFGWSYCHPQPSALPCTFNRYGSPQGRDIWYACKSACESLLFSAQCIKEACFCLEE